MLSSAANSRSVRSWRKLSAAMLLDWVSRTRPSAVLRAIEVRLGTDVSRATSSVVRTRVSNRVRAYSSRPLPSTPAMIPRPMLIVVRGEEGVVGGVASAIAFTATVVFPRSLTGATPSITSANCAAAAFAILADSSAEPLDALIVRMVVSCGFVTVIVALSAAAVVSRPRLLITGSRTTGADASSAKEAIWLRVNVEPLDRSAAVFPTL